jgi:predicted nuclease with TOPRIM domain
LRKRDVTDFYDSFQALEEKLLKAAEVFKRSQEENRALRKEVDELRAASKEPAERLATLERELQVLRRERDDVRARVEKILQQIDVLTKPEAGG